jgi:hypothetical protein
MAEEVRKVRKWSVELAFAEPNETENKRGTQRTNGGSGTTGGEARGANSRAGVHRKQSTAAAAVEENVRCVPIQIAHFRQK